MRRHYLPTAGLSDSDKFISSLTAKRFKLQTSAVNKETLLDILAGVIKSKYKGKFIVVSLVGGEGNGKSSLAKQLSQTLAKAGLKADVICTDDYNIGTRAWRWQYFEGSQTRDLRSKYDFQLMNAKIRAIKQITDDQQTVAVPTYNEKTGLALAVGEANYTHKIGKLDVLIVEGIMQAAEDSQLVIYLHTADHHRLKMRIIRDANWRNETDEAKITANFKLRQQNLHFPYTLRAAEHADVLIDNISIQADRQYDVYRPVKE